MATQKFDWVGHYAFGPLKNLAELDKIANRPRQYSTDYSYCSIASVKLMQHDIIKCSKISFGSGIRLDSADGSLLLRRLKKYTHTPKSCNDVQK